ncbi:MAG: PAS domain S-box protein [Pseudomonas sp.]|jgi:PAS domain S-box-containing protein|nr:PAS domain S-box protein [Pseudomonas sp.]MDD2222041.1 PAS domain S-box protein [Pseudomonas sp.]MDY0413344.1 PAS domain S-box protein [Pseudomonas sp.]NLO54630.1 PAS domain S-box protein [Gammaproteobacteria bacterium]
MTTTKTSPELARWLVEQSPDATIYSDKQGLIRVWNQAAAQMFGFSAEHALGQSLDIIIPETLRAMHWRGFNAAIAAGVTKHSGKPMATKALRADGSEFYAEMGFALVFNDQGEVVGTLAQARDISERYEKDRAERLRLRELEKQVTDKT